MHLCDATQWTQPVHQARACLCGMPNLRAILIITFYLDTAIACRILPRWWHSPSIRCRLICHVTKGWAGYIGMHRASSQRRRWFLHLCAFKLNAKRVLDGQRTKTIWLHTTPIESCTKTSGPEIRGECHRPQHPVRRCCHSFAANHWIGHVNVVIPVGRAPPIMCSHMMLLCTSSSSRALLLLELLAAVTLFQIIGFLFT